MTESEVVCGICGQQSCNGLCQGFGNLITGGEVAMTNDPYAKPHYVCENCHEPCTEDEANNGACRECIGDRIQAVAEEYLWLRECGIRFSLTVEQRVLVRKVLQAEATRNATLIR